MATLSEPQLCWTESIRFSIRQMAMVALRSFQTWVIVFSLIVGSVTTAQAQVELAMAATPPFSATNDDVDKILACESSAKLLEMFETLLEVDRESLTRMTSNNGNLPWTTLPITGWRWESATVKNGRIILAIEGPLVVAIYEASRSKIEMSVHDYSEGNAVPRGYAGTPRYFAHRSSSVQHVTAMSVKHFSNKAPELFKIYYYFAGPTREIVNREKLPRPIWLPTWAK